MASFDGGIVQAPEDEGAGTVPKVLVERFVGDLAGRDLRAGRWARRA